MKPKGFILYEGRSLLGGDDIVVISTLHSKNTKTGDMVQVWILPKNKSPLNALQTNDNHSICGECPLQGQFNGNKMVDRVCYVNVGQAPNQIWKTYKKRLYPKFSRQHHASYIKGRILRLGAYGDPAAMPIPIIKYLCGIAKGHTGYTHQLKLIRKDRADQLAKYCMVSCETVEQHNETIKKGYRAFTVIRPNQSPPQNSVQCPYYTHNVQCTDCKLCDGSNKPKKSVYVIAHAKTGLNLSAIQEKMSGTKMNNDRIAKVT